LKKHDGGLLRLSRETLAYLDRQEMNRPVGGGPTGGPVPVPTNPCITQSEMVTVCRCVGE
jgi:hypothetical protein